MLLLTKTLRTRSPLRELGSCPRAKHLRMRFCTFAGHQSHSLAAHFKELRQSGDGVQVTFEPPKQQTTAYLKQKDVGVPRVTDEKYPSPDKVLCVCGGRHSLLRSHFGHPNYANIFGLRVPPRKSTLRASTCKCRHL